MSSAPRSHHQLRQKSSLVTPTRPQLPSQGRGDSPPLTNRPYGHRNPYLSALTHAASARHKRSAGPCPNTPHNHFRCRIRPPPGLRTYLPSPPAPAPSQFHRSMASPNLARPASCTAAQYSNQADQHRPRTFATDRRPAKITCGVPEVGLYFDLGDWCTRRPGHDREPCRCVSCI